MTTTSTSRCRPVLRRLAVCLIAAGVAGAAAAGPQEDLAAAQAAFGRRDFETVVNLLRPLAEQGNADAQTKLASLYSLGVGVPQDPAQAAAWYRKAADQGDAIAEHNLGVMYLTGRGVTQDAAEGVRWLRKAADQGDAVSQYHLGTLYQQGEGVTQDLVQAWKWFKLAAAGFPANDGDKRKRATRNLSLVASRMMPAQIAQAEALAKNWKPAR